VVGNDGRLWKNAKNCILPFIMGFELHITRKEDAYDDEPALDISLAEWLAYVGGDPEFRLDNFAQVELPDGGVLRTEKEGIAVWTAYSLDGVGQNHAWFTYYKGSVDVKNPDQEIINKMVDMAQALGARVVDDEGTVYEKEGYLDRPLKEGRVTRSTQKKTWRKFWK
jgi:hypothetical protein